VTIPLVSDLAGIRKAHDLLPFKGLLPVDRIEAEHLIAALRTITTDEDCVGSWLKRLILY
jgi:hypothetical protein